VNVDQALKRASRAVFDCDVIEVLAIAQELRDAGLIHQADFLDGMAWRMAVAS
jgi:hypothetical protein